MPSTHVPWGNKNPVGLGLFFRKPFGYIYLHSTSSEVRYELCHYFHFSPSSLSSAPEAAVLLFFWYGSFLRCSQKPCLFIASAHKVTIRVHGVFRLTLTCYAALWSPTVVFPRCSPFLLWCLQFVSSTYILHLHCTYSFPPLDVQ